MCLMEPKILSWNINGLGEEAKKRWVGRMRRRWKAHMMCIQETKMEVVSRRVARRLWGDGAFGFAYLSSTGRSGVCCAYGIRRLLRWRR